MLGVARVVDEAGFVTEARGVDYHLAVEGEEEGFGDVVVEAATAFGFFACYYLECVSRDWSIDQGDVLRPCSRL